MALDTTSSLPLVTRDFYETTFLENLKQKLVFAEFTKKYKIAKGFGPSIQFRRYSTFGANTTALTEGTVPTNINLSVESVSATVLQYGDYIPSSDFLLSTHMNGYNPFVEDALTELSYRAAQSIDTLVRNAFGAATGANFSHANGKTFGTMNYGSDVISAADIRKMVRLLKGSNVPYFDRVNYVGIIGIGQSYDLQSEVGTGSWIDVHKYTSASMAEKGELGKLYSCRLVESNNLSTLTSADGTLTECYFFGKDAVAMVDITDVTSGDRQEMNHVDLFIKEPGSAGSADPINQISTVGYKFPLASKRLQDSRVRILRAGETAIS